MICIDHETALALDPGRDRFAESDISCWSHTNLHLGPAKPHVHDQGGLVAKSIDVIFEALALEHHAVAVSRDSGSVRSPDQFVHGQSGDFSRDVPQGDVDTGKRLKRHALLTVITKVVVDLVPDDIPIQGIVAKNDRLNDLFDDCLVGNGHVSRPEALAPSGDSLVGRDLDQMSASARVELLREPELFRQVILQYTASDTGDLHDFS